MTDQEILGAAMAYTDAHGGGGGGTTNYNNLDNLPQINGETLSGNKSASDLGLADSDTVDDILDGTDIDSFGDVETALADKQNALTAGNYISIANDGTISVTQSIGVYDVYSYVVAGRAGNNYYYVDIQKYENGVLRSNTRYVNDQCYDKKIIDDRFSLQYSVGGDFSWHFVLLTDSNEHKEGESIVWRYNVTKDFTETFNVSQDESTDLATKGDVDTALATKVDKVEGKGLSSNDFTDADKTAIESNTTAISGIKDGESINSFSGVESALSDVDDAIEAIDSKIDDTTEYPYADVITIEDAVPANLKECNVKIEPVQSGTGTPSPENVRLITGHSSIVLTVTKPNMYVNGTAQIKVASNWTVDNTVSAGMATDLSISGNVVSGSTSGYRWVHIPFLFIAGKTVKVKVSGTANVAQYRVSNNSGEKVDTFTDRAYTPSSTFNGFIDIGLNGIPNINFKLGISILDEYDIDDYNKKLPYYTLALGDTIFGGTVDFDSGVMTVDSAKVDMGDLSWFYIEGGAYFDAVFDGLKISTSATDVCKTICEAFDFGGFSYDSAMGNHANGTYWAKDNNHLRFKDSRYTDASLFTTAVTGVHVVHELETPLTIQLTPEQIQLLQGQNTLYASTGQISVTVNGVAGSIGAVQEQVNELRTDLSKGYLVKTFNVEGHANDTSIDFSALKPSDYNGFVNAYSCNGSGAVIQKCKNDVIYFVEALGIDATITIVYTVSQ